MPVNDGQERVTAFPFVFDLQPFAEGESGGEAIASESTSSPLDTLYDMKPIDGFATEDEGESDSQEAESGAADQIPEESVPEEVKKEQSPEANEAFKRMRQELEQTKGELARRDAEIAKRFGEHGIQTFDDVVKSWDRSAQQQADQHAQEAEQQTETFQERLNAVVQKMRDIGYDEETIEARADAMIANFRLEQMELREQHRQEQFELQQRQQQEQVAQAQEAANVERGTKLMLEDYDKLKSEYGDLLPDLDGENPSDKLASLVNHFMDNDPETWARVERGYTMEDAFLVSHKGDILTSASKKGAQQTLNQVNGRSHLKPSGSTSEVETVAIPEETLKMYKQLIPGKSHKEYLEHYKKSMKG